MSHTPSTPTVNQPASATDPRYSTSGILNAQIKEKNRQGLLSTYGGRAGKTMDINKFADQKGLMRDPSAVPVLEELSKLYGDVATKSHARGVDNKSTSNANKALSNVNAYNQSVDAVDKFLKTYGQESGLVKGGGVKNSDKRAGHSSNWGASNKYEIKENVNNMATNTAETFNDVAAAVKKQKQQPAKK